MICFCVCKAPTCRLLLFTVITRMIKEACSFAKYITQCSKADF